MFVVKIFRVDEIYYDTSPCTDGRYLVQKVAPAIQLWTVRGSLDWAFFRTSLTPRRPSQPKCSSFILVSLVRRRQVQDHHQGGGFTARIIASSRHLAVV
ncbi:hypothetical protein pipiens_007803 [Culex pipiens pipiens]|uniref:Uncharacterized protein n=1 Tax=Culex pipiens pipiens TaxID=38569 RepID=A0ABD1DLY7_CULPP